MRRAAVTTALLSAVLSSTACGSSQHSAASTGSATPAPPLTTLATTTVSLPNGTTPLAQPPSTPTATTAAATPPTTTAVPTTRVMAQAVQETLCPSQQEVGILADFGHRRTPSAAQAVLQSAQHVGFQGLHVERRKCHDYAVVLAGLKNIRQGRELQHEAASVGLAVTLDCRTHPVEGGLAAVFGHRRRRAQALQLEAKATSVGFQGLEVVQDTCNDWEVDLYGLKTPQERRSFAAEARTAGFHVTFEPG